jgi:hypothetical protein
MFEVSIDYRAPSRETLFLGDGWGVRDVRGPYLSASEGEIIIYKWALSRLVPSVLTLTLSLSSRADVNALFVRASGKFGTTQCVVDKTQRSIITIPGLLITDGLTPTVIKLSSMFRPALQIAVSPGTMDIVAIDELRLTRGCHLGKE